MVPAMDLLWHILLQSVVPVGLPAFAFLSSTSALGNVVDPWNTRELGRKKFEL
jgi:hypothetical protein